MVFVEFLQCVVKVCWLRLQDDDVVEVEAKGRGNMFHCIRTDLYCEVQKHKNNCHLNKNHHDNLEICIA